MQQTTSAPDDQIPVPTEKRRRGVSIVWLIPLVAGAIAIWLAYTTLAGKGPSITIIFKTAEGLEAGKTKIKYRDVEVGLVTEVKLAVDLSHIVVSAEMTKDVEPHVNEGTRFWIVKPRVGAGGVSGLSTLVSGAFIEVDPGEGGPERAFVGLEQPPLIPSDVAGKEFELRSDTLDSVSRGSPIQFRGLEVGEILGYELNEDGQGVTIHAFVKEPYDQLVTDQTRFWNVSGIDLALGAGGVRLSTGSLQSLLVGGIAFDTPLASADSHAAEAGRKFTLYDSLENVTDSAFTESVSYLLEFDGSVRGLSAGAPVEFRGIKVGRVTDVSLVYDIAAGNLKIPVVIELEPGRVGVIGDVPLDSQSEPEDVQRDHYEAMTRLVDQGLRAQLAAGNLLTGALIVALDFHKNSPKASIDFDQPVPKIPTVRSNLEGLAQTATDVVNQIAALPIEEIGADLRSILQSADALVSSSDAQQSVETLSAALDDVRALLAKIDGQADPLITAMLDALKSADLTLAQSRSTLAATEGFVGNDSEVRDSLDETLREISGAARSIRIFADYLERHPEALLRGK